METNNLLDEKLNTLTIRTVNECSERVNELGTSTGIENI